MYPASFLADREATTSLTSSGRPTLDWCARLSYSSGTLTGNPPAGNRSTAGTGAQPASLPNGDCTSYRRLQHVKDVTWNE